MNLASTIEIFAGGPGSGCNPAAGTCGRPTQDSKVVVYHGTSEKAARSILKEGLRSTFGNKSVYASADKDVAVMFAVSAAGNEANREGKRGKDVDNTIAGIVVINDARKAGLSDNYSSHYTGAKVAARFISRVELYRIADLQKDKSHAVPIKVIKKSDIGAGAADPVTVYSAVLFVGTE